MIQTSPGEAVLAVSVGVAMGTAARWQLLRVDYRQYPSYPQGYVIHLTMGFVAAFLGALAVPALVNEEYAGASFLALAATQFREVRKIEREALMRLEESELVGRGTAYIEGIARVFEARNYLAMVTGLVASLAVVVADACPALLRGLAGVGAGLVAVAVMNRAMVGLQIRHIATVKPAPIGFEGPRLSVGGVVLMNVARKEAREVWQRSGLGAVIEPKDPTALATLATPGQRQAIAHDVSTLLGTRMDLDEPEFTPMVRRDTESGRVVVAIVPMVRDSSGLIRAIERIPVLEASVRKPQEEAAGRMAFGGAEGAAP